MSIQIGNANKGYACFTLTGFTISDSVIQLHVLLRTMKCTNPHHWTDETHARVGCLEQLRSWPQSRQIKMWRLVWSPHLYKKRVSDSWTWNDSVSTPDIELLLPVLIAVSITEYINRFRYRLLKYDFPWHGQLFLTRIKTTHLPAFWSRLKGSASV